MSISLYDNNVEVVQLTNVCVTMMMMNIIIIYYVRV